EAGPHAGKDRGTGVGRAKVHDDGHGLPVLASLVKEVTAGGGDPHVPESVRGDLLPLEALAREEGDRLAVIVPVPSVEDREVPLERLRVVAPIPCVVGLLEGGIGRERRKLGSRRGGGAGCGDPEKEEAGGVKASGPGETRGRAPAASLCEDHEEDPP